MTINNSILIKISLGAVILTSIGTAGYLGFTKYQATQKELEELRLLQGGVSEETRKENVKIINALSAMMIVPEGEVPTIASVSDIEKLKDQPFFKNAQNGDKVIIYPSEKRAILYRPDVKKIVEVSPINLNSSSSGQTAGASTEVKPTPTPTPKPSAIKILLLNGTSTSGLTNKVEPQIKSTLPQAAIEKDSAAKSDYQKTTIYVLTESAKSQASDLANVIKAEIVSDSPYGEDLAGKADIAIIVGADKE